MNLLKLIVVFIMLFATAQAQEPEVKSALPTESKEEVVHNTWVYTLGDKMMDVFRLNKFEGTYFLKYIEEREEINFVQLLFPAIDGSYLVVVNLFEAGSQFNSKSSQPRMNLSLQLHKNENCPADLIKRGVWKNSAGDDCLGPYYDVRIPVAYTVATGDLGREIYNGLLNIIYQIEVNREGGMVPVELIKRRDLLKKHVNISRGFQVNLRTVAASEEYTMDLTHPTLWSTDGMDPLIDEAYKIASKKLIAAGDLLVANKWYFFDHNFICGLGEPPLLVTMTESERESLRCTRLGVGGEDIVADLYKLLADKGYTYDLAKDQWLILSSKWKEAQTDDPLFTPKSVKVHEGFQLIQAEYSGASAFRFIHPNGRQETWIRSVEKVKSIQEAQAFCSQYDDFELLPLNRVDLIHRVANPLHPAHSSEFLRFATGLSAPYDASNALIKPFLHTWNSLPREKAGSDNYVIWLSTENEDLVGPIFMGPVLPSADNPNQTYLDIFAEHEEFWAKRLAAVEAITDLCITSDGKIEPVLNGSTACEFKTQVCPLATDTEAVRAALNDKNRKTDILFAGTEVVGGLYPEGKVCGDCDHQLDNEQKLTLDIMYTVAGAYLYSKELGGSCDVPNLDTTAREDAFRPLLEAYKNRLRSDKDTHQTAVFKATYEELMKNGQVAYCSQVAN